MSCAPPRGNGNDQTHWPRRIGLRPCDSRDGWQRGSACCQMQKISAGKFHVEPPFASLDYLVGERQQLVWNLEAEHLCGLEVNSHLEFHRSLCWEIGRFGSSQDAIDVGS
jgi:hypothetical protein